MNGNYLLDTNIVIALFEGDQNVAAKMDEAGGLYLSSVVVGKLLYGALNSGKTEKNLQVLDNFFSHISILPIDQETANYYARIKKRLKDKGKPIPENDIWIAAQSFRYSMPLITRDSHFEHIEEIETGRW